jgi:hypothetical protein
MNLARAYRQAPHGLNSLYDDLDFSSGHGFSRWDRALVALEQILTPYVFRTLDLGAPSGARCTIRSGVALGTNSAPPLKGYS